MIASYRRIRRALILMAIALFLFGLRLLWVAGYVTHHVRIDLPSAPATVDSQP